MDIKSRVEDAEKFLKLAGIPIYRFCDRAGIRPITWRMWRTGTNLPQMTKWLAVEKTLATIQEERRMDRKARKLARKKAAIQAMKAPQT